MWNGATFGNTHPTPRKMRHRKNDKHLRVIDASAGRSLIEFEALSKPDLIEPTNPLQTQLAEQNGAQAVLRTLARLMFAFMIILIPFRFRFVLLQRPVPPIYQDYTDFLLFLSDIALIATLGFWITSLILKPRLIRPGPRLLALSLAGLTGFSLVSSLFSIDRSLSLYHGLRLLLLGGLYLFIVNEITNLKQVIIPVLIQVFVQASVAVGQFIQGHSLGLIWLGEWELNPDWNGVSVVTANGVRLLRAYGIADHPNILGGCLACALILIAGWLIQTHEQKFPIAISVFSLGILGLFFTFSRAAWLALALAFIFMAILLIKTHQAMHFRSLVSLVLGGSLLLLPFLWQNLSFLGVRINWQNSFTLVPQENQSIGERQLLDDSANQIFADHALTGVGLGTYPLELRQLYPQFPVNYQPAHMVLLDVAAETGIFGALFYAFLVIVPFWYLLINRKKLNFSVELMAASGLLLLISVISLFDYYPWLLAPGRLWFWLALGLWTTIYQSSLEQYPYA